MTKLFHLIFCVFLSKESFINVLFFPCPVSWFVEIQPAFQASQEMRGLGLKTIRN